VSKFDQNVKRTSLVQIIVQRVRDVSTFRLRLYGLTQNIVIGVDTDIIIIIIIIIINIK